MDGVYQPFIDFALPELGQNVIDIGCGYGNYSKELQRLGKTVKGVEYNSDYVKKAKENGIDCEKGDAHKLKYKDAEFDSAVLFEVLEHIPDPEKAIEEALRVTKKNVVITVPNSTEYQNLKDRGLTYYHMITDDHINFFTARDMQDIADRIGANVDIRLSEPTYISSLLKFGSWPMRIVRKLESRDSIQPLSYYRLYCVFTQK